MSDREKRIRSAQLRVLFQVPFFAPGVAKLPCEVQDLSKYPPERQTAYTDGERIVIHGPFVDRLTDQQLVTLLCHEVMHPCLGHLWRIPPGADPGIWNEACDHAVNLCLKEFSEVVTRSGLADPFPFPEGNYLADPAFKGMAEEQIYTIIKASRPPGGGKGKGKGPAGPGSSPMPSFGDFVTKDPAGQPMSQHAKNGWQGTFIQMAKIAQGRGELPAGIQRMIGELIEPKVDWVEVLRSWLRERYNDDWNFMRPEPCYAESGFMLPSLESERCGRIVFATDTSGSIDQEMLRQFQSEKQSALDDLKPTSLVDIYCDSKVHKVKEYTPGDQIDTDAPGGGGTDFKPVFKHVEKLSETPRCLVYLTDLDGTFPDKDPGFPVLWVTWTKGGTAPFGQVIYTGND